jgi:prevent-host-death family protein
MSEELTPCQGIQDGDPVGAGLIPPNQGRTVAQMSTATIEQFQRDPAALLAVVEKGEPILISRGAEPVARLLPVEGADSLEIERENWFGAAQQNLARAYGLDEPEYRPEQIVEANPDYEP